MCKYFSHLLYLLWMQFSLRNVQWNCKKVGQWLLINFHQKQLTNWQNCYIICTKLLLYFGPSLFCKNILFPRLEIEVSCRAKAQNDGNCFHFLQCFQSNKIKKSKRGSIREQTSMTKKGLVTSEERWQFLTILTKNRVFSFTKEVGLKAWYIWTMLSRLWGLHRNFPLRAWISKRANAKKEARDEKGLFYLVFLVCLYQVLASIFSILSLIQINTATQSYFEIVFLSLSCLDRDRHNP